MRLGIGILLLVLEPIPGQQTSTELLAVSKRDSTFEMKFGAFFAKSRPDWPVGWQLALDMGESLAAFLEDQLVEEQNRRRRLLWTAAYGLAVRESAGLLLSRRILGRPDRDRVMAFAVLALGPTQSGGSEAILDILRREQRDPEEIIAAALALARFQGAGRLPKKLLQAKDPGILAAALYCRASLTPAQLEEKLRRVGQDPHHDLVWRAWYLGGSSKTKTTDLDSLRRQRAAEELLSKAGGLHRREAAWCLAAELPGQAPFKPPPGWLEDQPLDILLLLAAAPQLRREIFKGDLIQAAPPPTQALELRRRLIVLHARTAPTSALPEALGQWQSLAPDLRSDLCLALAWRLFRRRGDVEALRSKPLAYDALPEMQWLELAMGKKIAATRPVALDDPALERALGLAARGALSDPACAQALEQALWLRGSHPGRAGLDLHRQLLAELLLDGSAFAGTDFVPGREAYKPKGGLDRASSDLYPVAYELYKFIGDKEPWSLAEHRLRR